MILRGRKVVGDRRMVEAIGIIGISKCGFTLSSLRFLKNVGPLWGKIRI